MSATPNDMWASLISEEESRMEESHRGTVASQDSGCQDQSGEGAQKRQERRERREQRSDNTQESREKREVKRQMNVAG